MKIKKLLKSAGLFAMLGFIFNCISDKIANDEEELFRKDVEERLEALEEKNED